MSQLTVVSYYTRKVIKISAILLVLFFVSKVSINLFTVYWRSIHPILPPPPDTSFGKLPRINFPKEAIQKPKNFQLETADGELPKDIPFTEKVYFVPQERGKFLSLEKATSLAKTLGFKDDPRKIDEDIFVFENASQRTSLTVDVLTGNFEYAYAYLEDQTLINPPSLPAESDTLMIARAFLSKISRLTNELKDGEYRPSYWKISGSQLIPALAASEADFVRINIFRKKVDNKYPVVSPKADKSLVSLLISGFRIQNEHVVEAKYLHFESDREKYSRYPIKTVEQAWEELKTGNYYLASYSGGQKEAAVKIRRVYLAYFDPYFTDKFLQPVIVFQGDDNFYGYVSAIPPEWLE
ncbi:MAG: hypothetical protein ABH867_04860 [Patescibacteria group bacterium]